jgi:hypothetical protein
VLTTLSQLLADEPRIAEIDINPLLADAAGVIALDARVRVSAAGAGGAAHFAIRPYPARRSRPSTGRASRWCCARSGPRTRRSTAPSSSGWTRRTSACASSTAGAASSAASWRG